MMPHIFSHVRSLEEKRLQKCMENKLFENYALDVLRYIKPIRGIMKRKDDSGNDIFINCVFHDEKEWRFIPKINPEDYDQFPPFMDDLVSEFSNKLSKVKKYALPFEYSDIRYFLLNDSRDRDCFIDFIMSLATASQKEKYELISKIVIFEEEREDW